MDLQNEAIELQKVFHRDYKTYWEETEAIKAHLEARFKALGLYDVSKSLNMEHNATSVEYAEAIIDMYKNPENSNRAFKIVVLENTIDKLKQDLANI